MRVMGIDPGCGVTGWGIIEEDGGKLRHVADGCIRSKAEDPLPERLGAIFRTLAQAMRQHQPQVVSVEAIFMAKNAASALKLGHARGAAMVAAASLALPIHEYTAVEVKKSVVGFGKAEKVQVQEMVMRLLGLNKHRPQDASDALAAAICHLHHDRTRQLLGGGR